MSNFDPRELEWERLYEQNDTPWDKGTPAPSLIRFLEKNTIAGRVLVPGCGRGHEVHALAKQPGCLAVGLDLSPTAIAEAIRLTMGEDLEASSKFLEGDFFALPSSLTGAFDWLVEHTFFCAIEPQRRSDYVRSAL
ncbi:MAG TPA: methyltransferase domain-containing protein, partial [Candidatus Methylacidiphilales bacterium]